MTPLLVGERINAEGSRRARRLILATDEEGIVALAREQLADGAAALDVCVAIPGEPGEAERMVATARLLADRLGAPLFIDSSDPAVLTAALDEVPGHLVVNSVSLQRGQEAIDDLVAHAVRQRAPIVALCIDEIGLAQTRARKLAIARRLYDIVVRQHGCPPDALLIDALALPVTKADPASAAAGQETIAGVRDIKQALIGVQTILGISDVSFGLAAPVRTVLNAAFLHHCVEAGLDAAIVDPRHLPPYSDLAADVRDRADEVVLNRAGDALRSFVAVCEQRAIRS